MHTHFNLVNPIVRGDYMLTIFIRVLLIYLLLLATIRAMGKRQIGELQLSELITTILLSELAAAPIIDDQIPLAFAVIPIATLLSLEVIISFAVTKIPALKPIFDGKPSILICRGRLDRSELARARISLEEFLSQIRLAGIGDISDVEYAILEQNGQLSVIPKRMQSPPDAAAMQMEVAEPGIAHAIIVDGAVSTFDLDLIQRDQKWLTGRLRHYNAELDDVFLFTVDDEGKENLIRRSCDPS